MKRKPSLVRCRIVDEESRVACAMHHTLTNNDGPLWLMIPIDEEVAKELVEVIITTLNDEVYVHEINRNDL